MKLTTSILVPFQFRASHSLAVRPDPHWHTYEVTFELTGPVCEDTGFVVDMGVVREIAGPLVAALDGTNLNDCAEGWSPMSGECASPTTVETIDDDGGEKTAVRTTRKAAAMAARFPTCECLAAYFAQATVALVAERCGTARLTAVAVKLLEDEADGVKEWGNAVVRITSA